MNRDFLKEAIADAKAVKESAIANAKAALEEAFSPQLKSMLASKLEEMDSSYEEDDVKEEVEEKLSADVKEEKLSKTFKHSPEVKGEKVTPRFNNGRVANTTLQRVFQRISNK